MCQRAIIKQEKDGTREQGGRWEENGLRGVQLRFSSFSRVFLRFFHGAGTEDTAANVSNMVPVPKKLLERGRKQDLSD